MPLKNYNNNERQITNSTFSSIVFTNPESKIMPSRLAITYFNKLMKISIALRNNPNSNESYATYDTDNQISVYVSHTKAEILRRMMIQMLQSDTINNVCIELKNGLLKVSDGSEYNSKSPCISISYADESGNVNEVIYECKTEVYNGAYNYKDNNFETMSFSNLEIETVIMTLDEYYKAAAYAQAAAVMEADMFHRNSQYQLIRSIAEKVGVPLNSGNRQQQNTKSFLGNGGGNKSSVTNTPAEYEVTSFDAIANSFPG